MLTALTQPTWFEFMRTCIYCSEGEFIIKHAALKEIAADVSSLFARFLTCAHAQIRPSHADDWLGLPGTSEFRYDAHLYVAGAVSQFVCERTGNQYGIVINTKSRI